MPIDYTHSKIYKIIDNTNGNIYIGSTTQKLTQRLGEHTRQYKKYFNEKFRYVSSFDIIKNGNYEIILIEEVNCNNKEQLHKIERMHIEANECVNLRIPSRTKKEYYNANREEIIEKQKEYYKANIEEIKEYKKQYSKEYRDVNGDKIKEYSKEYRDANKDTIKEYKKQYYEDSKLKKKQQKTESE